MRALVCGAGITGLTLARRLEQLGWDVVVLERAAAPRTQGYMIDFFGPGYDAAEAMGSLPRLEELGYQVTEAGYYDERGRRRASLSYRRFADVVDGRLLSIMRPDLERVLREELSDRVDVRYGTALTAAADHGAGVVVTAETGERLEADLLVGADGIHSTVRASTFGDERRYLRRLGFHTAAFTFDDARVHAHVRDRFCLTNTTGASMGFYGLRDGRVAVFAVHRTPDPTLPADARDALRRAYGSLGWLVPDALAACPESREVYYDLVAQVELPRWSSGRIVLAGDAAFAVSLLAGQGASLGMAGAYVLAEQLARAGTVEAALTEYERVWRPVVTEKQRVARQGARWFLPESRTQLRVRGAALRLFRLPGLDKHLAGLVSGKSTTVVRNLRDQAPDRPAFTASET